MTRYALLFCLSLTLSLPVHAATRTWYIAIEESNWDYFPGNLPRTDINALQQEQRDTLTASSTQPGSLYRKVLYRAYTDATFAQLATQPAWLGFLGPVLRAEVGDQLELVVRNKAARPYSLHIHGLPPSENSVAVPPGGTHTYRWQIDAAAGPGPQDASSIAWFYHSDVDTLRDTHAGLAGVLIVTRRGLAHDNGMPLDVDQEWVIASSITDENLSWLITDNQPGSKSNTGTPQQNRIINLNGFTQGSLPMPQAERCQHIRFYHLALGEDREGIALRVHGNTLTERGRRVDTLNTPIHSITIADMLATRSGRWQIGASQPALHRAGLHGRYQVTPSPHTCD